MCEEIEYWKYKLQMIKVKYIIYYTNDKKMTTNPTDIENLKNIRNAKCK